MGYNPTRAGEHPDDIAKDYYKIVDTAIKDYYNQVSEPVSEKEIKKFPKKYPEFFDD